MESMDKRFEREAEKDFQIEQQTDETKLDARVASITTRQSILAPAASTKLMLQGYLPQEYKIDASPFVNRPFYLGTVRWRDIDPIYSTLDLPVHQLPRDVFTSNLSLKAALKMASLFRSELVINISLSGTLVHSGVLLVGVLPPLLDPIKSTTYIAENESMYWINSILSGPHAFLYANEATSVTIDVPWYCNTDYAELDTEIDESSTGYQSNTALNFYTANYASLVVMVLQPLLKGNSTGEVSLVLEACFKNLELYLPAPRFLEDNDWTPQAGDNVITNGMAAAGTSTMGPIGGMIGGAVGSLASKATTGLLNLGTSKLKKAVPFLGDALDAGRGLIGSWTGLHNPNNPTINSRFITTSRNFPNATDVEQYFEKMDPYCTENRIISEPIFSTDIDEMSLSHISSKRQYLGYFKITTENKPGDLLWSRPISPFQGGANVTRNDNWRICANNIELLHSISRAWRGDISIILQSSMNNKQFTKLKIIKYYNPSRKAISATPSMHAMANAPSQLLEFNSGGQELEIKLPYLSRNEVMPCSSDFTSEALMHGIYYVYLAQNLVVGDESPKEIAFNVYIKCEPNFRFYGYSVRPIEYVQNIPDQRPNVRKKKKEEWTAQSGNKVMNEPQQQKVDILQDHKDQLQDFCDRLRPTIDIRPYIRRMYLSSDKVLEWNPDQGITSFTYPLSAFVGELPFGTEYTDGLKKKTLHTVSSMYYGKSVGFKCHLQILPYAFENVSVDYLKTGINISIFYVPPGLQINNMSTPYPATYYSQTPNQLAFTSDFGDMLPEVTYLSQPSVKNDGSVDFEFSIPNITWYKFMGSMYKYMTPDQIASTYTHKNILSTADFGHLVVKLQNMNWPTVKVPYYETKLYVGLTDESRLGFHTIAPVFSVRKGKMDVYLGENGEYTVAKLPRAIYFGHTAAS